MTPMPGTPRARRDEPALPLCVRISWSSLVDAVIEQVGRVGAGELRLADALRLEAVAADIRATIARAARDTVRRGDG